MSNILFLKKQKSYTFNHFCCNRLFLLDYGGENRNCNVHIQSWIWNRSSLSFINHIFLVQKVQAFPFEIWFNVSSQNLRNFQVLKGKLAGIISGHVSQIILHLNNYLRLYILGISFWNFQKILHWQFFPHTIQRGDPSMPRFEPPSPAIFFVLFWVKNGNNSTSNALIMGKNNQFLPKHAFLPSLNHFSS